MRRFRCGPPTAGDDGWVVMNKPLLVEVAGMPRTAQPFVSELAAQLLAVPAFLAGFRAFVGTHPHSGTRETYNDKLNWTGEQLAAYQGVRTSSVPDYSLTAHTYWTTKQNARRTRTSGGHTRRLASCTIGTSLAQLRANIALKDPKFDY